VLVALAFAACTSSPDGSAITFDICGPITVRAPTATPDELASLDDAFAMWRALGVAELSRDDFATDPAITLEFREAAPAFHGLYDAPSASIYVNLDLIDREPRAIAIAHELGHAFGLGHVSATERVSVMNPGNLVERPDDGDRIALDAVWGRCR